MAWEYDDRKEELNKLSVLVEMPVIDPVILKADNKCYLFGSLKGKDENGALYQWESDKLLSTYTLIQASPVKTGKGNTRRGGSFFMMAGSMYAATQSCVRSYGEHLNICKVDALSRNILKEEVVSSLLPQRPYTEGLHTLNIHDGVCVVDGLRFLFRPWEKMRKSLKR
jgi:hypothetical protein